MRGRACVEGRMLVRSGRWASEIGKRIGDCGSWDEVRLLRHRDSVRFGTCARPGELDFTMRLQRRLTAFILRASLSSSSTSISPRPPHFTLNDDPHSPRNSEHSDHRRRPRRPRSCEVGLGQPPSSPSIPLLDPPRSSLTIMRGKQISSRRESSVEAPDLRAVRQRRGSLAARPEDPSAAAESAVDGSEWADGR